MSNTQSSRRQEAQEGLGVLQNRQELIDDQAIKGEEYRRERKLLKRQQIEDSSSYSLVKGIATVMDKYFIDPILGLIPGVGDIASSIFVLPYIYISIFQVKSIPLTMAVIYNSLIDMLVGLIPFLGNVVDFFLKSYKKSWKLIVGFVEDDREVINEVNKKALLMSIMIFVFCFLVYLLWRFVSGIVSDLIGFLTGLF